MSVHVKDYVNRPIRDNKPYCESGMGSLSKNPFWKDFTNRFGKPMRENLRSSLNRLKNLGAESILEVGPGSGDGSNIAIKVGLTHIELVEVNPETVRCLAKEKYRETDILSMTIHNGDVRDVLPQIPDKSIDISLIFDNTISLMQEPTDSLDGIRDDFRVFVLKELLRKSTKATIVGVADVSLMLCCIIPFTNC